jgi:CHAD domain-containing protein
MPKTKNWEISHLTTKEDLTSSAKVILCHRLDSLLASISSYFAEINEENLHQIRISLRRVRYSMEVFIKCFNRKKYLSFYKIVSSLQDLSGSVRDIDVLKQNLKYFWSNNKPASKNINFNKVDENKNLLQSNLKLEFMKFIHSKELKEFKKLINHHS